MWDVQGNVQGLTKTIRLPADLPAGSDNIPQSGASHADCEGGPVPAAPPRQEHGAAVHWWGQLCIPEGRICSISEGNKGCTPCPPSPPYPPPPPTPYRVLGVGGGL